jgi:dipeptidyl aminopeptidase/acylaminoacyl peptidase
MKRSLKWMGRAFLGVFLCLGLGVAWAVYTAASARTDVAGMKPVPVQPTGVFTDETSCFHQGGYDAWIGFLRSRNDPWYPAVWLLPLQFPREDYEHAQATLDCRYVSYESDGLPIGGWMVAPKRPPGARLPVLIFNRGGNGSFGQFVFATAMMQLFPYAEEGFLVLASNYRGANEDEPAKYGRDEFGGAEVRDVERLLALVDRLPNADPDNVFMLGGSRGVMMSYLVARNSKRIRAIASINGQVDLEADLAFRPEMERVYAELIPDYATRKREVLAQRSALRWAEELPRGMPILLLHGSADDRVDPANGPRFKQRLDALGHPNKLVTYADDDHFLSRNRAQARAEIVAWFRSHARPATVAGDTSGTAGRP